MAQGQYCIVDFTIDGSLPIDGLVGMTLEAAQEWIAGNQIILSEAHSQGHLEKYGIQPDAWPESSEQ